jgi:DHA1 family tetracycline resistance protein-like MFS transporter
MVGVQTVAPLAETKETGRAALAFIYATVLLDAMGFGIIIPVLPGLVVGFVGDTARGAIVYGIFGIVWALMQFTFSPLQGVLSDRFGRRPVLILSSLGLGLDYILMALSPNLSWLFLGRIISGITAASFSAASAYVADVTPPEKRASAFGFIGVMWGIGFILGPAMGGLLGAIGPRIPFWGAALLSLTSVGYGVLVLPESLRPELRSRFSWRRANPIGSVGLIRSRPGLPGLALVNFLNFLAFQVLPSIFVIYAGYRYGWDITAVGLALAIVGASTIVVQGLVVRPFIARFGETRALLTGLFFGIASFVAYGLAPNGTLFLAGVLLYAPLGLVNPALQGIMTRMVSPSEQGQLQGANASILGLTGIIGPGLFTVIFAFFIGTQAPFQLPGAPFILSAFLMVGALAIAARVTRRREEEIGKKLVTETVVP